MPRLILTVALLLGLTATSASAARVEIETLTGESVAGELRAWTPESLTLTTDQGEQTFKRADLLSVRPETAPEAPAAKAQAWVELADGSQLEAVQYTATGGSSHVELLDGSQLEMPTRMVKAVRFKEQNETIAAQWDQIQNLNLTSDLIVIRKNEAIDYLEGVLGEASADKVNFELDGETIPVNRGRVEGLIYYTAARRDLPEAICVVQGPGATRIRAQQVSLRDGRAEIEGVTGVKLSLPLEQLQGFDFSLGKIEYLSEMQPLVSQWKPYFELFAQLPASQELNQPRVNQALEGGPLLVGGKSYRRGLALRSGTELAYRLPDGFNRLTMLAGIDDRVGEAGAVQLTILGDDRELYSEAIRGGESPKTIDVEIAGIRKLTIAVDYGDDLDIADHLDLCDARISK